MTYWSVLAFVIVAGCGDGEVDTEEQTAPTTTSSTTQTTTQTTQTTQTTGEEVTWYRDVKPLLESRCVRCHSEGGLGPGDFTDYAVAVAYASQMVEQIEEGEMPPPVSDPECRDYQDSHIVVLPDDGEATINAWVDAETPMGVESDYVPPDEMVQMTLEDVDFEIYIAEPYTVTFTETEEPGNEYRCFVLDPGHSDTLYLSGLAPLVDNKGIVHHLVLFAKARSEVSDVGPSGYECMEDAGGADLLYGMLHTWAPGGAPLVLEEGMGLVLEADEVMVMQIHYYDNGEKDLLDHSGYAFRTEPMVDQTLQMLPHGPTSFLIPAGDDNYSASLSYPMPLEVTAYAAAPHMHLLGSGYHLSYTNNDDETCLLYAENYDFDNQMYHVYKEPAVIPAFSWLSMECTWNNSESNEEQAYDPPIDISWGEGTNEEMCFAFILVDQIF